MKNGKSNLVIKNATDTKAELYIYSDIVSDEYEGWWAGSDVYPESVKLFLDEVKGKNLSVFINSNGGSVMSALAIYNMLQRHIDTGHMVTTYVDGVAASSASFIAMVGAKSGGLFVPENSFLMVHRAWLTMSGNSEDLRNMAETLDKIDEVILSIYEKNLKDGVNIDTIKELVANESWISGKDASQYFNIQTTDAIDAVACVSDITHKNTPNNLFKAEEQPKPFEPQENALKTETEAPIDNQIQDLLFEIELI